jgi:hypothetical protein
MADQRPLLRLTLRLALAWLVLSASTLAMSHSIVTLVLPLLEVAVNVLQADFNAALKLTRETGSWAIQMQPLTVRPIPMTNEIQLREFVSLQKYITHVDHTLVPVVLLLTGVAAWPFRQSREMAVRLLLAVPALIVVAVMGAPVLLIGQVQITLVELALRAGAKFSEPWMVTLMVFMESGGRWLLPIAAAIACITISRWIFAPPAASQAPSLTRPVVEGVEDPVFPPVTGA